MKKRVLCFGDSNTLGYDPRDPFGGLYPAAVRWPDRLGQRPEWAVIRAGVNGREIPHLPEQQARAQVLAERWAPLDLFVVMLGTNDLFCMRQPTAEAIAARMEAFLRQMLQSGALGSARVLLVAPPPVLRQGEDGPLSHISLHWASAYQAVAQRLGVAFADAGAWQIELGFDGIHFSPQGHLQFEARMHEQLLALWPFPDGVS